MTAIGIIVFDGVRTAEVIAPVEVFGTASKRDWFKGASIALIGVEPQPTVRTSEGVSLVVDCTIADDIKLDVLIVPGANDVDHLLDNAALNAFIRKHSSQWIFSMCAGAFILASSGVLNGQKATTWHGGESTLQAQFPQVHVVNDQPVVIDRRRITANGGLVGFRAALVLLAQLTSKDRAREIYDALSIERIGDWSAIEADMILSAG